jgi:hypothetical protein
LGARVPGHPSGSPAHPWVFEHIGSTSAQLRGAASLFLSFFLPNKGRSSFLSIYLGYPFDKGKASNRYTRPPQARGKEKAGSELEPGTPRFSELTPQSIMGLYVNLSCSVLPFCYAIPKGSFLNIRPHEERADGPAFHDNKWKDHLAKPTTLPTGGQFC